MIEICGNPKVDLEKLREELLCLYEEYYSSVDYYTLEDKLQLYKDIRKLELSLSREVTKEFNEQFTGGN